MRADATSRVPQAAEANGHTPIGQCDFCGRDIVAPSQVLVWADDRSYHQDCYQSHLARRMTDEGVPPSV